MRVPPPTSPSDADLLTLWRSGDRSSGKQLFERYYDVLERFFANKVSRGIDDLVQETFVACVEARDRLVNKNRFRSYLFSIAYNVLRGHYRKHYRDGPAVDFEQVTACDLHPGPGTLVAKRREHRLLVLALRNVPVMYQTILELHYWEEMTSKTIGEILGIPAGTVRSRLRRAHELLEDAMERLSTSREELTSTLDRFDHWVKECRALMQ